MLLLILKVNKISVEPIPISSLQEGNKLGYWPPFRSTGQIKNASEPVVEMWKLCCLQVLHQNGNNETVIDKNKYDLSILIYCILGIYTAYQYTLIIFVFINSLNMVLQY